MNASLKIWRQDGVSAGSRQESTSPFPASTCHGFNRLADTRLSCRYAGFTGRFSPQPRPRLARRLLARPSRCVTGKDKVLSFRRLVAGEAGLVLRLIGRFTVSKIPKPPATGRGVLF